MLGSSALTLWQTKICRMALLHALGCVCKFVLRCKNIYRIGPRCHFLIIRVIDGERQTRRKMKFLKPYTGGCGFFFKLNFLPPYLLHLQGDKNFTQPIVAELWWLGFQFDTEWIANHWPGCCVFWPANGCSARPFTGQNRLSDTKTTFLVTNGTK